MAHTDEDQKILVNKYKSKASIEANSAIPFKPQFDAKIMATDRYIRAEFDGGCLKRGAHRAIHLSSGRESMLESSKG